MAAASNPHRKATDRPTHRILGMTAHILRANTAMDVAAAADEIVGRVEIIRSNSSRR